MNQDTNLENIVEKMKKIAREASQESHLTVDYTKSDIKELIKKGKSDDYICDKLGAGEEEIVRIRAAVDAHYTMGTYCKYACKIRNRKLKQKEKKNVYQDIEKGMKSEELAEKYRITRIKAMMYCGWYTRRLNQKIK